MHRVSTNLTLFFKFFIPTFWIVFFGALTVTTFVSPEIFVGANSQFTMQLIMLFVFSSGILMLYLTLMRLKRVEMDSHFIFITDYFRSFRYPYHNIKSLDESNFLSLKVITIHFKKPGSFGEKATFVASNKLYQDFWEKHPELKEQFFTQKIQKGTHN